MAAGGFPGLLRKPRGWREAAREGVQGDGSALPSAPAPGPAEQPADTRNLWGCFLSLSRRRKLAERSEASGQVSEFNVSCKGERGDGQGSRIWDGTACREPP